MFTKNNISTLLLFIGTILSIGHLFTACNAPSVSPTPYILSKPNGFVAMVVPKDNPTTYEGIALGRRLFFDPVLSGNQSISCAHCHQPALAFTDASATSSGSVGINGSRSAPSLLNIGFHYKGVFWDGRSPNLEDQALHPIRDSVEMKGDWVKIIQLLENGDDYPGLFEKAFGHKKINKNLVAKALAQFQRTLLSFDSKFDRVMREETTFTKNEKRGWTIFFDAGYPNTPMAECSHCHSDPLFTNLEFTNNGIDSSYNLLTFPDAGLGEITGNKYDNGKFRTPTLRNIAVTAPYMHDGRFKTLEEVIDHYNTGGHYSPNKNPNVKPLDLTAKDKADLILFLNTLTDSVALQQETYFAPIN